MRTNLITAVEACDLEIDVSTVTKSYGNETTYELYFYNSFILKVKDDHITFKSGANYLLDDQDELIQTISEIASYY